MWGTCLTPIKQNFKFLNLYFSFTLCLEGRHMPHTYQTKFSIFKFVFWGWDTCLTLLQYSQFFLNLVFWDETHASHLSSKIICFLMCVFGVRHMPYPSWKYSNFCLILCLKVRHMPHLYQTKFYIFRFVFFGWGTYLTLLKNC